MIDKLEMLIALAREKHFGRAAEVCKVTQPSLSTAIRALEELYGVPLVQRGPRFIGLTVEGEKVLARARTIVAESRAIRSDLEQMRNEVSGTLRLGVIPTVLTTVQAVTGRFLAQNRGARLNIHSMSSQDILKALADYQIDAGISYAHDDVGDSPTGRLEAIPLYRENYALLASESFHPLPVNWAELAELQLCLLTRDMQNRRMLDRVLSKFGVKADPVMEADSVLALVSHVMECSDRATILPLQQAEFFALLPGLIHHQIKGDSGIELPEVALIVPAAGRRSALVEELVQNFMSIDSLYRSTETPI